MDGAEFDKTLAECKESLEKLLAESQGISERLCGAIEEQDGEKTEFYWGTRTMNKAIDDVLSDVCRRLDRFRAGNKDELPTVLVMAIECCERLRDTAELCRAGKQDERRDLEGQISSNLGYLAHHLESMREDEYLPTDMPEFRTFWNITDKIFSKTAERDEMIAFICNDLDPLHEYLTKLRTEAFWEEK